MYVVLKNYFVATCRKSQVVAFYDMKILVVGGISVYKIDRGCINYDGQDKGLSPQTTI